MWVSSRHPRVPRREVTPIIVIHLLRASLKVTRERGHGMEAGRKRKTVNKRSGTVEGFSLPK
jgi:hypothetical protein